MRFKKILIGILSCSLFILPLQAQTYSSLNEMLLSLVYRQDSEGLNRFRARYGSVDYQDQAGQTPLCRTVYTKNYAGFALLVRAGAHRNHACMQHIPPIQKAAFNKGYALYSAAFQAPMTGTAISRYATVADGTKTSITPMVWGVGAVFGVGAIAALAFSGGGGGSSGSSSSTSGGSAGTGGSSGGTQLDTPDNGSSGGSGGDNPGGGETPGGGSGGDNPGGGDTPGGDVPYPLTSSYFETAEYKAGKFLPQIKASAAYARFYTATKSPNGTINLSSDRVSPVKVAVIDVGVLKNTDIKNKLLGGYNYDYGPCRTSSARNCWVYKETGLISKTKGYAFRDGSGNESGVAWEATQAQFNAWAALYPADYTWRANWYNYAPLMTEGNAQHGTHVAGIIGAEKNNTGMQGVAPNAQIIPIRYDFLSGLSNPIKTAVDSGARVINASLGTASSAGWNAQTALSNQSSWKNAMAMDLDGYRYLADKQSTVFVVAAGNEGQNQPSMEAGAGLVYPALKNVMIVVTAVSLKNPTQLASYANKCGAAASYCIAAPGGDNVPGSDIVSTIGSGSATEGMSGTSMATPVVSGAVSFLMGAYPNLTASQVVSLIFETATNLGASATFGYGLLNMDAATAPVGKTTLATTHTVRGERVALSQTVLRIPAAFKEKIAAQLPFGVAVLDKYDRSFLVPTAQFVRSGVRDTEAFKNKLHRFAVHQPMRRIQTDSQISFGFSKARKSDSAMGVGAMDVLFQLENQAVRFYYMEESLFGAGETFDRALINPFTAMNEAYGINDTFRLNQKVNLKMGFVTGQNGLFQTDISRDNAFENRSYAFEGGLDYMLFEGIKLGALGGVLQEEKAVLGMNGRGAFETNNSQTYYMGFSAAFKPFQKLTLTGSYFYGRTQGGHQNAFMQTGQLLSDGFAADVRWQLNKTDVLGLQLLSPLRIRRGYAAFDLPVGRDYYTDTIYRQSVRADLKPEARETDWSVYYKQAINKAMHFKTQTGIRFHPDHQADARPDYQFLIGFDWQFNML